MAGLRHNLKPVRKAALILGRCCFLFELVFLKLAGIIFVTLKRGIYTSSACRDYYGW